MTCHPCCLYYICVDRDSMFRIWFVLLKCHWNPIPDCQMLSKNGFGSLQQRRPSSWTAPEGHGCRSWGLSRGTGQSYCGRRREEGLQGFERRLERHRRVPVRPATEISTSKSFVIESSRGIWQVPEDCYYFVVIYETLILALTRTFEASGRDGSGLLSQSQAGTIKWKCGLKKLHFQMLNILCIKLVVKQKTSLAWNVYNKTAQTLSHVKKCNVQKSRLKKNVF